MDSYVCNLPIWVPVNCKLYWQSNNLIFQGLRNNKKRFPETYFNQFSANSWIVQYFWKWFVFYNKFKTNLRPFMVIFDVFPGIVKFWGKYPIPNLLELVWILLKLTYYFSFHLIFRKALTKIWIWDTFMGID